MFQIDKVDGVTYVGINSDRATADHSVEFRNLLINLIEKEGVRKLVVDFRGVLFVDSTFLGSLVVGLKKVTEHAGDIKVANLEKSVRIMFELTRLYKVFEIFETANEAVESF